MRFDSVALRALGTRLRQPHVLAFTALLGFWVGLYFSMTTGHESAVTGTGQPTPIIARLDGHYMYLNTLSLVFDGDFDLGNQYDQFGNPYGFDVTPLQRPVMFPVGTSILQAPLFLAAHGMARVANRFGAGIPLHGYTLFHQRITFLGALLAGFLSLWLSYRLACRHASRTAALYGVVVVGVGTALLFYSAYWVSYAHAYTALSVALLVEYWDRTRGRHDLRRWMVLGVYVGLAALTRMQEVLFAILPASEAALELVRRLRSPDPGRLARAARLVVHLALAGVIAMVIVSPQLIAQKAVHGAYLVVWQGEGFMRWDAPFFSEVLFSTRNGLFVVTPLAYLCCLGLLVAPRRDRALALGLAVAFFAQAYVNGAAWDWFAGWAFSARRMVDTSIVLVVGMAFGVDWLRGIHARWPRLAPHLALLLLLAPLVIMNVVMSRGRVTGSQRQAVAGTNAASLYIDPFSRFVRYVHENAGNPFSWPANLVWAARHDVSPSRYDDIVGDEKLMIEWRHYRRPGTRSSHALRLSDPVVTRFGAGRWGKSEKDVAGKALVWAYPGARLLVPLFLAEDEHWIVYGSQPAAPGRPVKLVVNGVERQTVTPTAQLQAFRIDLPAGAIHPGTNELAFRCDPPPAPDVGCLAVESLELVYQVPR